ncbi:MAG TPA: hypothetical protein DD490_06620 [Acidobacteria bacterium]|nr:hypothetical protein [Acidobacteriota bacterium]
MLALVLFSLVVTPPVAAQSSCAPVSYCLFAGCWYELLNNSNFSGTQATCTNWNGVGLTTSSQCYNSAAAVLSPSSGTFTQNFYVPADSVGSLDIALEFATIGTPTSLSDKIVLELYEGTTLRKRIIIYTLNSATSCHREDYSFGTNTFAGKNLQLRVRGIYLTPGVSYHINWMQIFAYL